MRRKQKPPFELEYISEEEAKKRNLFCFTESSPRNESIKVGPNNKLETIRYEDWLKREAQRITRYGDRKAAIVVENGNVSLWIDDWTMSI